MAAAPDLRHLRYFVAVAEELHFGRAARRLNIAQPPLSQQIRQLERLLGVQLLARTSRRVELTPAGAVYLDEARRVLAANDRAAERARRAARGEMETLRVGFTDAAMMGVLPEALPDFRARFPGVHVDLHEEDGSTPLLDALERDLFDVALTRGPIERPGLGIDVLVEERFCLVVPETHRFAARARVPLRLVKDEPLVHFPRRLAPAYHDVIVGMCQRAGFTPRIAVEAVKYQTHLGLVAAGVGVCFVPRSNRIMGRAGVVHRTLTGDDATSQVVAAYRPRVRSVALDGLLAAARAAASRGSVSRAPG